MAQEPIGNVNKDPREEVKPPIKERAFYCSQPEFNIRKEGKPAIQFEKRWLVTDDAELIKHLIEMAKSLKVAGVPISIIEVPVNTVGTEPLPGMIERALGG